MLGGDDLFAINQPFYASWLFWLMCIIGMLLFVILIMFVFCIKLTQKQNMLREVSRKKQQSSAIDHHRQIYQTDLMMKIDAAAEKSSGLARKESRRKSSTRLTPVDMLQASDYEDQELEMKVGYATSDEE